LLRTNKTAGVDEVGRGCLAGPVFAAAVILNKKINIRDIKDSKQISYKKKILLAEYIKKNSIYAVASASVEEINKINILNASLLAMKRALDKLTLKPSIVYIDGLFSPKGLKIKHKTFVKGDEKITSISAASIIAKATRDIFMIQLGKKFPKYKWNKNFGYGTAEHLNGIKKYGITKHHRKIFKPVHNILMNKTRETL
jgi:ribonuclease HII